MTRFTFDAGRDTWPVWSPDGNHVAFDSNRTGHRYLYQKRSDLTGAEVLILGSPEEKALTDWSPDGRSLLYTVANNPRTGWDIWHVPLSGDRKPVSFVETAFLERAGQFSPDGRWVAYHSNESGPVRGLRAVVSGPRGPTAGVDVRWDSGALEFGWPRVVLHRPERHADGGRDHDERSRARTRHAGRLVSDADLGRRDKCLLASRTTWPGRAGSSSTWIERWGHGPHHPPPELETHTLDQPSLTLPGLLSEHACPVSRGSCVATHRAAHERACLDTRKPRTTCRCIRRKEETDHGIQFRRHDDCSGGYPAASVDLEIVDVVVPGSVINVNERPSFRVKVTNRGRSR